MTQACVTSPDCLCASSSLLQADPFILSAVATSSLGGTAGALYGQSTQFLSFLSLIFIRGTAAMSWLDEKKKSSGDRMGKENADAFVPRGACGFVGADV